MAGRQRELNEKGGREHMELTIEIVAIAIGIGLVASLIGGIIGGLAVGAKHIGAQLSAMMGGFFGPIAGLWGVAVGLAGLYIMTMMGV